VNTSEIPLPYQVIQLHREYNRHDVILTVLKVVQERRRVSPASRGRVPIPRIFYLFIFDLKMASIDAFLVVFYAI